MAIALEKKIAALVGVVKAIHKELILTKMLHTKKTRRNQVAWNALSLKVATSWDCVTAVDEIVSQREKQW